MKIVSEKLAKLISSGQTFALEIGSGPGRNASRFFTLDVSAFEGVDIVADLNNKLDLIPDNSVTDLYSRHTLEHVDNLLGLMEEIQRICVPGALVKIIVPHFSNTLAHSDPTHRRFFGLHSMYYFCDEHHQPQRKVPSYYSGARFVVENIRLCFYRQDWLDKLIAPWFEYLVNLSSVTQLFYERHFAYVFPAWEVRFVIRVQ